MVEAANISLSRRNFFKSAILASTPRSTPELIYSPEAESQEWNFLSDTGFDVWGELARGVFNQFDYARRGVTRSQERISKELDGNIHGFIWEYMQQLGVLYNPTYVGAVDNEGMDVRGMFGDRALRQMLDKEERLGQTARGNTLAFDFLVSHQKTDSLAVIASSKGDTGLSNGPIRHEKTQIYVFDQSQTRYESFTFISEMDADESRVLLELIDGRQRGGRAGKSELQYVSEIVGSPAFQRGRDKTVTLESIPGLIKEARILVESQRASVLGRWDEAKMRQINLEHQEMERNLGRREELRGLNQSCQQIIDQFHPIFTNLLPDLAREIEHLHLAELTNNNSHLVKDILQKSPQGRELAHQLSRLILELYAIVTGNSTVDKLLTNQLSQTEYINLYQRVRQLVGCNGGVGTAGQRSTISGVLGTYFGMDTLSIASDWHEGYCRLCDPDEKEKKWVGSCNVCKKCEDEDSLKSLFKFK